MLRLNVAIPPAAKPNLLGLLGGDLAGFPNGRRVFDDVVTIELRAFAGATYPLVNPSYTPDGAASAITEGLKPAANRYQSSFPYLGLPHDGFDSEQLTMGENHSARPHPEHVVLEIGDDLGALIVYTDPELHGTEIEKPPRRGRAAEPQGRARTEPSGAPRSRRCSTGLSRAATRSGSTARPAPGT